VVDIDCVLVIVVDFDFVLVIVVDFVVALTARGAPAATHLSRRMHGSSSNSASLSWSASASFAPPTLCEEVLTMPNTKPTTNTISTTPSTTEADTRFPHERLDAYSVARDLVAFAAQHRSYLRGLPGETGPQLERALVSTLLNIAEAAGRQGVRDRARVFAVARGEACEAAAALDVALLYRALSHEQVAPARALLVRLGQMLTRLSRP